MALQKKPIYVFENENEAGINKIPLYRLVLVESLDTIFFLQNKDYLTDSSTVLDAIHMNKLIKHWTYENDSLENGPRAENGSRWNEWRLINVSTLPPTDSEGEENDIWFQRDPDEIPPPPINLTTSTTRKDGIYLQWENPSQTYDAPIEEIHIYRNDTFITWLTPDRTTFLDENVNAEVEYTYYLKNANSLGESDSSNIVTGVKILEEGSLLYSQPGTYNWTVPEGITKVNLCMVGGGGSGAAYCGNGGELAGGGYAGEVINQEVNVTPGEVITLVVGAGAPGVYATDGDAPINGNTGEASSFKNIIANGGSGGETEDAYVSGYQGDSDYRTTCGGTSKDGEKYLVIGGPDLYGGQASGFGDGGDAVAQSVSGENGDDGVYGSGGGGFRPYDNSSGYSGAGGAGVISFNWSNATPN